MGRRLTSLVLAVVVAAAVLGFTADPAFGEPTIAVTENCDVLVTYGIRLSVAGFPPNTPFDASLYWGGSGATATFTTDASGSWSFDTGSDSPMGLVTFTVRALSQTFVATIQDPCDPPGPDVVPPSISVPAPIVDATSPSGAVVHLSVAAHDIRDPNPVLACDQPSGTTFPIGTSTVHCTATDASGNEGAASFDVVVRGASDQLGDLRAALASSGATRALIDRLTARIDVAIADVAGGRPPDACGETRRVVRTMRAQRGDRLPEATAGDLIARTDRIRSVLGCVPPPPPYTMPTILLAPACHVTNPGIGIPGPYGASVTIEGFAPGSTVDLQVDTAIVGFALVAVPDISGGWGPYFGSYTSPLGLVTVTASVDGVQVAHATLDNPCVASGAPVLA